MRTQDRADLIIKITEDAGSGISIQVAHNGRFPKPLAGFSKDVLRKARPLMWNSFERRVLRRARSMSRQSHRLVKETLIAERCLAVESKLQAKQKRIGFVQRLRLKRAERQQAESRVVKMLPEHRKEMTLGQILQSETGLSPAAPRPETQQERNIGRGR